MRTRKSNEHEPQEAPKDLGFGTSVSNQHVRTINPDGSYNLVRKGLNPFQGYSIYHRLISMSWTRFNILVICGFLIINTLFALAYLFIGVDHLGGMIATSPTDKFFEAFFFSAQTITTVGYGRVNPIGISASTIAAIESLFGLLGFALATGLLYGRFSRPEASILYSKHAIVAPYRDINGLMFRIANERDNQLIEVEVQVILSTIVEENGKEVRRYVGLELERGKVNFFPAAWTIVHPIDEKSPLWELDEMSFKRKSPELLILIKGFDDIFSSTVHARSSYAGDQFEWGKKFINVHGFEEDGTGVVHLNRLDDREPAKLNGMETPSPTPKQSTESAT